MEGSTLPDGYSIAQTILAVASRACRGLQSRTLHEVMLLQLLVHGAQRLIEVSVIALQDARATASVMHQHVPTLERLWPDCLIEVCGVDVAQQNP